MIRRLKSRFSRRSDRSGPTILLYHRIAEDSFDPWSMCVSAKNFAEQVEWLADRRIVLPLADFADAHRKGALPPDAVAITFDDGYACNALVAAPILESAGLPATVFLSAESIERCEEFWWDELQCIVLDSRRDRLGTSRQQVELGRRHEGDSNWSPAASPRTPRQRAFMAIWSRLQQASPELRDRLMSEIRAQADRTGSALALKRPMTAAEARSANRVLDFGSHALTHSSLPALSSLTKEREIRQSRDRVEALAGIRPTSFAYPFGDADGECETMVEEAGYGRACVTGERAVTPGSRLFAMPRKGVGNVGARGLASLLGDA